MILGGLERMTYKALAAYDTGRWLGHLVDGIDSAQAMVSTFSNRGTSVLLVRLAPCLFVLLPTAVQSLAIELLYFPDAHSRRPRRTPA